MFKGIFKELEMVKLKAHSPLFYSGDVGDKFYIVLEGEVKVCVPRSDEEFMTLKAQPPEKVSPVNSYLEMLQD